MSEFDPRASAHWQLFATFEAARDWFPDFREAPENAPYLILQLHDGHIIVFGRLAVNEILQAWTEMNV